VVVIGALLLLAAIAKKWKAQKARPVPLRGATVPVRAGRRDG
jgi:hypothetical protein